MEQNIASLPAEIAALETQLRKKENEIKDIERVLHTHRTNRTLGALVFLIGLVLIIAGIILIGIFLLLVGGLTFLTAITKQADKTAELKRVEEEILVINTRLVEKRAHLTLALARQQ